jgi:FMN-dependent NADH-azoreductase
MPALLHLDSSPTGDRSVSRALTAEFVKNWQAANTAGTVVSRDLTTTPLKPIDGLTIGAVYTPADSRSAEQKTALELSDTLTGELLAADEYVIGLPMHNFSISGSLKLWIDQIVRSGVTFASGADGVKGLLAGKKVTFVVAAGFDYGPGTAMESFNYVEPYLRSLFGFLGITDVTFINAYNAMTLNHGADRTAFLAPHIEVIRTNFAKA